MGGSLAIGLKLCQGVRIAWHIDIIVNLPVCNLQVWEDKFGGETRRQECQKSY